MITKGCTPKNGVKGFAIMKATFLVDRAEFVTLSFWPSGRMVAGMDGSTGRERLQAALREALKARDKVAVPALRSALAAIDNAGAVPPGPAPAAGTGGQHVADAAAGLGAGEGQRRRLSEGDVDEIVRAEIAERQAAARDYEQRGHADRADRLRREACVLISAIETNTGIQASRQDGAF
jgi:uncharacterized protein YqeY